MKRITLIASLIAVVAGCGRDNSQAAAQGNTSGNAPALPVEVVAALRDTVVEAVQATGQIEAVQSIQLRPEVEGRLVEIIAREGAEVRRDAALFRIDDAELKAQVERVEAELTLAEQSLRRVRQLIAEGATSEAEVERAEATARGTRAQLDLLKLRLDRTVVRAPFAGIVGERLVSLGDYVNSQTRLTTLQTIDPQRAAFNVPERYADRVQVGQPVTFNVAAVPGRTFTGRVDFVDPSVQLPGRTILIKAEVPNRGRELRAGMFIEAHLAIDVRPESVVIPEDAILPLQGADFVWVAVDGKATRRQVELGVRTPGWVEATGGVSAGEQVVVGGQERLAEGMGVNPIVVERRRPAR